jgi:hypothetical protein
MFQLVAPFEPAGDQPQAIEALTEGLRKAIAAASVCCNILHLTVFPVTAYPAPESGRET